VSVNWKPVEPYWNKTTIITERAKTVAVVPTPSSFATFVLFFPNKKVGAAITTGRKIRTVRSPINR